MTRELLWARLRDAGLAQGDTPAADESRSPWYVRTMLGVAGWIGALFLLGFVGAAFAFIMRSATAAFIVGALLCAGVAFIFRMPRPNDVVTQFAFAVALAGQAMMAAGLGDGVKSVKGIALMIAVQQAVLFFFLPNFVHRVWAAWTASAALLFALHDAQLSFYGAPLLTAAFAVVWLREFDYPRHGELLRAAGYGFALTLLMQIVLFQTHWGLADWLFVRGSRAVPAEFHLWAGPAAGGLVLVATVAALLHRERIAFSAGTARAALAGALILAVASVKAPGLATASVILVLGYANGNPILVGGGIAALVAYLSYYYYWLQMTLLDKSMLLAALGAALLAARFALKRWWHA